MQTPRLIFLHLPRTGGTTLIYEHLFPGVAREERAQANYDNKMESSGGDDLLSWTPEERNRIRILVGHMPFGLAERFDGPSEYATMLRDPITRTLSDYTWCQTQATHGCHRLANELSLVAFVEHGYSQTRNCYTRWLSGATYGEKFPDDDAMLAAAEQALAKFSFVGITELFDESVRRLCARYGIVRREAAGPRNVTLGGKRRLSPRETDILRQNNALDLKLYQRYREAFVAEGPGELAQGVS